MRNLGVIGFLPDLDTIAAILKDDPTIVLELGGYADAAERSPDTLALARAQFILEALVQRSIARARLQAVSYGSGKPQITKEQIAHIGSEAERKEARRHNRRVVPKVLSFDYKP
jgi:outer membrane protein OmpA-like peptidoglycan-associated protein